LTSEEPGDAVPDVDQSAPDPAEIQRQLAGAGVRYFFGAYTDLHGVPKSKAVPIAHFTDAVAGSELYTVGALEGMGDLGPNEDECVGRPDLSGLTVLPWDPRYALAPVNLYLHGRPYPFDFRRILQDQAAAAEELGYRCNFGVEPEVYVLRRGERGYQPWVAEDVVNPPTRGYDIETTMLADAFLEPMIEHMNALGWDVYSFDHEGGAGQYEFDFDYADVVTTADRMVVFRLMCKAVARSLGCIASFMPKPFQSSFGSGAHFNLSLAEIATGANVFDGAAGGTPYSEVARQFTAGVLAHGDALTAVLAPTVNSYKRLLPRGLMNEISWAPVYRAYGDNNRTLMCRLPANRRCLEVRVADSAVNFHLAAALTLAAGLEGVRKGLDPGEPVNYDTYSRSETDLAAAGVHRLPADLGTAVAAFRADELMATVLGEEVHRAIADYKAAEWLEYNTVVSEWEREKYLQLW
jgi:glutamine synthetase